MSAGEPLNYAQLLEKLVDTSDAISISKIQQLEHHIKQLNTVIDRQSEVIKAYERLHEERKHAS